MDLRESAITTAVNFLKNPKVARSSLLQKRNFLVSKGLTDCEIQEAFERVGIFTKISLDDTKTAIMDDTKINIPPVHNYTRQLTTFEKIKDVVSSMALISGVAYGIYIFYKKYIEPFLFGRKKKSDNFDELTRTTKAINGELIRVREEINKQKQSQDSSYKLMQTTLQTFRTEIETIKGILLNHKNFSSSKSSNSANIGHMQKIPSWQLNTKKANANNEEDKHDDADKHSNSSENETEVINEPQQKRSPANSDSSLEIM